MSIPSQIDYVSDGKWVRKTFNIVREKHNSTVSVSEIGSCFGGVHGLVDDFYFFYIFIFFIVEVCVGWVDDDTQGTSFFDVFLAQKVIKSV
jgi:hypothetical protein